MSKTFSKNNKKRRRPSSNENNTSFVKNVTSRVSGFLPATITKWFSNASASNTNGSVPTTEATDSSTEDEGPESPVASHPPPAKRMRYTTSNKLNHFGPTDANGTTSNIDISEIPVGHFPSTQFSTSRNNVTLTPIRNSHEACITDAKKDKIDRENTAAKLKSIQHTVASIGQSIAAKRKSIFDRTSNNNANKTNTKPSDKKRLCYKPTLLGSPFYPGRTVYGGAASSYISQPNIQQRAVALVKNDNKCLIDSTMSTSARRIMDLLESYSSPLTEARRMPQYTKHNTDGFYTSSNSTSPYENKSIAYKTQEFYVPGIASIMRYKQRSRLMNTTKAARQIIASHSSASSYPLPYPTPTINTSGTTTISDINQEVQPRPEPEPEQSKKMVTKVKTRVARTNRGNQDQVEMATPVKLPSATLQIDQNKLPKFAFDTPAITKLPATSTPKVVLPVHKSFEVKKNTEVSTSKPETVTSSIFKFSNPIIISCEAPELDMTAPKFTFASPDRRIDGKCDSKSDDSSVVGKIKEIDTSTKPKDWACPDCWVNNKSEAAKCVCCGFNKIKVAKCSVCKLADSQTQNDKCVNCEKMARQPLAKSSQSSKWECKDCWVRNEDSLEKCACCGSSKMTEASKAAKAPAVAEAAKLPTVGSSQFNLDPQKKNFQPISNPSKTTTFFGSSDLADSTFVSLAKTQKSDKWECSSCLIWNASDQPVCACCGAKKDPKSQIQDSKFNFGLKADTSFKFGIDPQIEQTKKPEMPLTPEPTLKEQSETNNNVLAETPMFTFALPAKKSETKPQTVPGMPTEPVKFSFGIPKNTSISMKKSEPSKIIDEKKEGLQEVPEVNFASAIDEQQKLGGLFAVPTTKEVEKDKPLIPSSNLFTLPVIESKKDTQNNPTLTSVEKTEPQKTFTLGSPTIRIASNLFGTPSTAGSSNLFSPPGQSSAVTTSTTSLTVGSSINLFSPLRQSNAVTTSTTSSTVGSSMNLFSPLGQSSAVTTSTSTGSSSINLFSPPGQNSSSTTGTTSTVGSSINLFAPPGQSSAATTGTPIAPLLLPLAPAQKSDITSALPAPAAPIFSFGSNGVNNPTPTPISVSASAPVEKPKFQFTFGNNNPKTETTPSLLVSSSNAQSLFKSNFATPNENSNNTNTFSLTSGNTLHSNNTLATGTLGGSNGISATNGLVGNTIPGNTMGGNALSGNGMSGNLLANNTMASNTFGSNTLTSGSGVSSTPTLGGTNGLPGITHSGGNGLQPNNALNNNTLNTNPPSIFGNAIQKENMWNPTLNNSAPSTNLFVPNTTTNSLQKPTAFTFGSPTQFNATSSSPAFGNNAPTTQNIFGMAATQNISTQPNPFSNPVSNQTPTPMFGSPQPNINPAPQLGMFGTPNISATPTFGAPSASLPSFEAPSMTPAPTATFSFGAQSPSTPVFGFGQQQPQQQQEQTPGLYSFGAAPQVQFNIGTANPTRRIRKAARRTQR
ncbi:unnamed protein product [Arctia plantaginis]|uniref:RanBP2-type domain-containing protein n=1 Tax=Arctia plantaginis TaxID=874455 RepID=A0A8S0Z2U1_ARCPL|nr:unnamed protein product [Arctia plantaginis]